MAATTLSLVPDQQMHASFNFMKRSPVHQTEKPYRMQYDPGEGVVRTNIDLEEHHNIPIHDFRSLDLNFDDCGFAVGNLTSSLDGSFDDKEWVEKSYYKAITDLLLHKFKADEVQIMEHVVRKRHPQHPISTGGDYEYLQPTTIVHTDFTPYSALEVVEKIFKLKSENYERIVAINCWKPLHGPLEDWPLALCDASTVDTDLDLQPADMIMRSGYTESSRVYHNPNQKWYYLDKQLSSEVLLFRQYDSDSHRPVIHSGFQNPLYGLGNRPRESIEVRAFLFFK